MIFVGQKRIRQVAVIVTLMMTLSAKADYQILFNTFNAGFSNPVFASDGSTRLIGSDGFVGQLYVGTSAQGLFATDSPVPFQSGSAGAGFIAGSLTLPIRDSGVTADTIGFYQLRVWNSQDGARFEDAFSRIGARVGQSTIQQILLKGYDPLRDLAPTAGLPSANLHSSFDLYVVPEPSTLYVMLIAGTSLALSRRRRFWFS